MHIDSKKQKNNSKDTQYDIVRSANCYNELKTFLQKKKKSQKCTWSIYHQEVWDKMLEFEQKYSIMSLSI